MWRFEGVENDFMCQGETWVHRIDQIAFREARMHRPGAAEQGIDVLRILLVRLVIGSGPKVRHTEEI